MLCSGSAFFSINLKSDGSVMCRSKVQSSSKGLSIQKVQTPAWNMYACVLNIHEGVQSYFDGELQGSLDAASSKVSEYATLDGTVDRIKVAEIDGDPVMEVSQVYVFARAFDDDEIRALYLYMDAIQNQSGCGPPVSRPYCGAFQ